ncbi:MULTISPECIES: ArnT family glycosyltransferase [Streptomyces]|uniref:ArnT family glycosyltransferase n=3 Tax=Streptomyces scabiei TaxID=1930 RepID=UPI0004E6E869|nr:MULTISPECIES: phospholipid carrier-dependent glycosyltransferase [Streptomyces]MBP5861552.1 phospholipid carrier-dependent glycosyltransferase [Streptomyces sp. LBUM 1484]MBP5907941.1 phospholipid carrier-dependent glycosyltransferase [Streptomyces sp. LBUM 1478]MBP5929094.1 phospholipid carrier-dependent glycosyltransferase [Streptomyces sp. LBUM 1479]KFG09945.1 glycosyltransferase [Streptomyces scabiei]MBP5878009.1 phospholipid carrier-dependent glycosyltransferase [Streptomyces sp. LBUM 
MTSTLPAETQTEVKVPAQRTAVPSTGSTGRTPASASPPPAPKRLRDSRTDLVLCGLLLVAIMIVQGWNIADYPALSDDEGTYLAQAWAVQEGRGLAHYTYWYDHPPLGWIQLAVLTWIPAQLAPESMTVGSMRGVMLLISAVSAVLVYVLGRRLSLPRWAAGLGMVLFGLSPLSVVLQREIFLDNIAVMWTLLAFCLAASPSRHLWHHFGAGLAAAAAVLTKETMLLVLPAVLLTMWRHSHRDTRKFALTGAVTACVLIGASYPLFALLKGELFPGAGHVSLWDGIVYQMSRPGSGFILTEGTGSHGVLRSWLYYDRVLPLGGLAGALLLLVTWRWSVTARALAGPALAVAILAGMALRPGYLPAMYVLQALPFLALVLAGGTASVAHGVLRRGRGATEPRPLVWARCTVAVALAALATAYVAPRWYDGNRTAMTFDANAPYRKAAAWLGREVEDPGGTRVLVDDALWLDLVHQGYEPGLGVIWFYKADLDPAVTRTMPRGWRDLDYVVASPTVRRDAADLPNVRRAMENSTPVATFGTGEDRIEIRRIDTGGADDRARGTGEAEDGRGRGTGEADDDRVRGTETAGGGR